MTGLQGRQKTPQEESEDETGRDRKTQIEFEGL